MASADLAFVDAARYDEAHKLEKWTSETLNSNYSMDVGLYGREGRRGHRINQATSNSGPPFHFRFGKTLSPANNDYITGFAHRRSLLSGNTIVFAQVFSTGPFALISLAWNEDSTISLILGEWNFPNLSSTILATSSASFALNSYNHFEWHVHFDTAGTSQLYANGGTTPIINYSGDLGTTQWTHGSFGGSAYNNIGGYTGPLNLDYSDIYIRDGTVRAWIGGSHTAAGAQWGDTRSYGLLSETGNGFYHDWTPSTGSNHGDMVKDPIPDDDATYNVDITSGHVDTYTKEDLPADVTDVLMMQTVHVARKEASGTAGLKSRFRTGGTNYDDATFNSLGLTYSAVRSIYQDKSGAAITPSDVNNGESGPIIQ
jgi:hypothetical protein